VSRIAHLSPRRVLEVGCGTGLLLLRIAPRTERYVGVDLSENALGRIGDRIAGEGLDQVELVRGEASSVDALVEGEFDTIIVNSVAQYFPSGDYLVDVIAKAFERLAPGGSLFLGDLRSKAHAPLFYADVEMARAPAGTTRHDLAVRVDQRAERDSELVVDPALFLSLQGRIPELGHVDVQIKEGRFDNEMSRFRYDVVLERIGAIAPTHVGSAMTLPIVESSVDAIRRNVETAVGTGPAVLRLTGIRNSRLVRQAELARLLARVDGGETSSDIDDIDDIGNALDTVEPGVLTSELAATLRDLASGYDAEFTWSDVGLDRFDVVLRSKSQPSRTPTAFGDSIGDWSMFTNRPAHAASSDLVPDLRSHLRSVLPDFMVPTAFVVLDALPRTPNGKIDRNALPAPDRGRNESAEVSVAPDNDLERSIAAVWERLLSLDVVGVETNVFDLGANSLLMVQASSALSELLDRRVSIVTMFKYPTVRLLATALSASANGSPGEPPSDGVLDESQLRGASRKAALNRQRAARGRKR
jgi:SAM-dependent methyltransferase